MLVIMVIISGADPLLKSSLSLSIDYSSWWESSVQCFKCKKVTTPDCWL